MKSIKITYMDGVVEYYPLYCDGLTMTMGQYLIQGPETPGIGSDTIAYIPFNNVRKVEVVDNGDVAQHG
jgi:hypothetical protein